MVCSFQSDHPVVTNYSFGKTLVGKKAEREIISLQLSPGALSNWRSDKQSQGGEAGVEGSQRSMLSVKLEEEALREELTETQS